MTTDEQMQAWIEGIHAEWQSEVGFVWQARHATFDADRGEKLCRLLESIALPADSTADRMLERKLVAAIWDIPHLLSAWRRPLARKGNDIDAYEALVARIHTAVAKVLGEPALPPQTEPLKRAAEAYAETMRRHREVDHVLRQSLAAVADQRLASLGFSRPSAATVYMRTLPETSQKIGIWMSSPARPRQALRYIIHLHMASRMTAVGEQVRELLGRRPYLLDEQLGMIVHQPAEWAAPLGERRKWVVAEDHQLGERIAEIVALIEEWVVPLFDELQTPLDLIKAYERQDIRLLHFREAWPLKIAAAYILMGDEAAAREIVRTRLTERHWRLAHESLFKRLGID